MQSKEINVTNKLGVHARPAGMIVDITGKSKCDVTLEYEENKVNAKSHYKPKIMSPANSYYPSYQQLT